MRHRKSTSKGTAEAAYDFKTIRDYHMDRGLWYKK